MRCNHEYILLAIILLFVIMIGIFNARKYVPYSASNVFNNVTSYEGFEGIDGVGDSFTKLFQFGNDSVITGNGMVGGGASSTSGIDIYSTIRGDTNCPPNPYSNSKGYLCIGNSGLAYDMLMTRGGNQTKA